MAHAGASDHWERLWASGLAKGDKFDVGGPSATLLGALRRLDPVSEGATALVPGAGRAYDALALAASGFATGLPFAASHRRSSEVPRCRSAMAVSSGVPSSRRTR